MEMPARDAGANRDRAGLPAAVASPRARLRRSAIAGLSAWALLAIWALLVPPYQVVDEVQHAMRATSVLADPWVTAGESFIVDQRHTNPMSRGPGPEIGKLFFKNFNSLEAADIPRMKARRWGEAPIVAEVRERWPAASYPPVYHWAVFAVAEPATALLRLTPYASTYAYRFASIFWAGLAWALVYALLESRFGVAAGSRVQALQLLTPMLANASCGVNPDALAIPLSGVAFLAVWRLLERGDGAGWTALALVAAALAKPTGLTLAVALVAAVPVAAACGLADRRRAGAATATILAALGVVYAVFYAWSRQRFLGTGPTEATFQAWAHSVVDRIDVFWISYWGWLGWFDYKLGWPWYRWLIPLFAINVVAGAIWLTRRRALAVGPIVWGVLAAIMCAGEFVYLSETGYNLQGRHLLVGGIGLAPLVAHDQRWAWGGLLGYLAVLHLRMLWQTFVRYYAGDAAVLWATLPFN